MPADADRLRFLRFVIEGYMAWRRDHNKLGYPETARVMGIPEPVENRRVLDLSDDQFLRVDRAFASCRDELLPMNCHPPGRRLNCGEILLQHYDTGGGLEQKACRLGFEGDARHVLVARYRRGLAYSEDRMYWATMPELDAWEAEIL